MKKLILSIALLSGLNMAMAQPGWNWPAGKEEVAKEKNAFYTDRMKEGNFAESSKSLYWLIQNAPDLNESIYINGAKIYEGLAEESSDAAKKLIFQDSALMMYDMRIKYFGNEAEVLNRKSYVAYKYHKDNKSKYADLKSLYDKTFELNGAKVYDNNLLSYLDVIRRFKLTGGEISNEAIFDIYFQITDIIAEKMKEGKNIERLQSINDNVDKLITSMDLPIDCKFVEDNIAPKLDTDRDLKLAKKVFGLLLQGKCSDSPYFVKAAEIVHEKEPSFGLAKVLGLKYSNDNQTDKAITYFEEAISLTEENTKKAEVHMIMAKMYGSNGQKSTARANARKALTFDPTMKEAYKFIGDLYMQSYNDCKGGVSRVDDRLVFIAAFEMYEKAGDASSMANAKSQFPSVSEIFEENKKEGEAATVGCWINETVILAKRPN